MSIIVCIFVIMKETKFKVGDVVRYLNPWYGRVSSNLMGDNKYFYGRVSSVEIEDGVRTYYGVKVGDNEYWVQEYELELINRKFEMKKKDLKTGMIVITRCGLNYMVVICDNTELSHLRGHNDNFIPLSKIKEDLTYMYYLKDGGNDIVCIRRPFTISQTLYCMLRDSVETNKLPILWQREKDIPEYTMEEIIEKVGFEFKIKK